MRDSRLLILRKNGTEGRILKTKYRVGRELEGEQFSVTLSSSLLIKIFPVKRERAENSR